MSKVITYLYPKTEKISSLKVFQDRTNQIRGFYFSRDNICEVEKLEFAYNYCVYFLFNETEDKFPKVYVGQSKNGIESMKSHKILKTFWNFCIMFTTDNNSFDATSIDYIEYHFINKLKASGIFMLENKDFRKVKPSISIYDKPTINKYISQIEFLLEAEGIVLNDNETSNSSSIKYYYPKSQDNKDLGKIYFKEGKFILAKNSIIRYPIESSKNWKYKDFYIRNTKIINELLENNKLEKLDKIRYKTLVDLSFNSPSSISDLMTGRVTNGWTFFDDLIEIRDK